jgi:hypothetical protein
MNKSDMRGNNERVYCGEGGGVLVLWANPMKADFLKTKSFKMLAYGVPW